MSHYFSLYLDQYEPLQDLSPAQKAQLFDAMFLYHMGEKVSFDDVELKMAWRFLQASFRRDEQRKVVLSNKNRDKVNKRYSAKKNTAEYPSIPQYTAEYPSYLKEEQEQEQEQEQEEELETPLTPQGENEKNSMSLLSLHDGPEDQQADKSKTECRDAQSLPHGENPKTVAPVKRKTKVPKGKDLPPYSEFFENCWREYPRKTAKHEAWRVFLELEDDIPPDMVQRIECRALEDDWNVRKDPQRAQFVPHMTTWLHRRGWEDEGCSPGESVSDMSPEYAKRYEEIEAKYNGGMPRGGETSAEIQENYRLYMAELAELDASGL